MSKNVLKDLTHTTEECQDNLKQMLERDGKISESLVKANDLETGTKALKKKATKVNQ